MKPLRWTHIDETDNPKSMLEYWTMNVCGYELTIDKYDEGFKVWIDEDDAPLGVTLYFDKLSVAKRVALDELSTRVTAQHKQSAEALKLLRAALKPKAKRCGK